MNLNKPRCALFLTVLRF